MMRGGPTASSTGLILVRGSSSAAVLQALGDYYRTWDFRGHRGSSAMLQSLAPRERREFVAVTSGEWAGVYVEHLPEIFELGYVCTKRWSSVPVIASRLYAYDLWECKAYLDRELLFKVGEDPDHELPWVGRPLDKERLLEVASQLGAQEWGGFLSSVLARRAAPEQLSDIIGLDVRRTFRDALARDTPAYSAWYRA